jgi:hypothetical protein
MSITQSTRRLELALPLFEGLDLGLLFEAQDLMKIKKEDAGGVSQVAAGLTKFASTLAKAGKLRTIRKLSAIARATDLELKTAEKSEEGMLALEDEAAERPFIEAFTDAVSFHFALVELCGLTLVSSEDAPAVRKTAKGKKGETSGASPSGA